MLNAPSICHSASGHARMIATVREIIMRGFAQFLLPPPSLAACVFGAVLRDTRGVELLDHERLNHFPASPLVSLNYVSEGTLHMVENEHDFDKLRKSAPLAKLTVLPALNTPQTSWGAGEIYAISVGVFPDAWALIDRNNPDILTTVKHAFAEFETGSAAQGWQRFCEKFDPIWQSARSGGSSVAGFKTARLSDWSRALMGRAAMAQGGRSIRALERRVKRWSGQTRRSLSFYASFEELGALRQQNQDTPLAALAHDAGFSDQSHMGRMVRKASGFSPADLNRRIETEEAFWCYRVLGERF